MPEMIDEAAALESTTVGVYRTAATVKGGRRFSFGALVVVGDRKGRLGVGYAKANQVPPAIEKAQKEARRKMRTYPLQGRTLPHAVAGRFGACTVRLLPAAPGAGVIAGAAVRAPLELLGIQDCLTKAYGSTNPKNVVKAVMDGLSRLHSKDAIASRRGLDLGKTQVEEAIERGQAYLTVAATPGRAPARAPVSTVKDQRGGPRKPRGRRKPDAPPGAPPTGHEAAAGEGEPST